LNAKRGEGAGIDGDLETKPTPWSPIGLRIEIGAMPANPHYSEEDFIKGRDRGAGRGLAVGGLAVGGQKPRRAGLRPLDAGAAQGRWRWRRYAGQAAG